MAASKAAPKAEDPEATEFGVYLTALRERDSEARGRLASFGVMARTILMNTGITVVDQTLANYHAGRVNPRSIRRDLLRAIVRFYGCTPTDLGPVAAAELAALSDLTSSDEAFSRRGCNGGTHPRVSTHHRAVAA